MKTLLSALTFLLLLSGCDPVTSPSDDRSEGPFNLKLEHSEVQNIKDLAARFTVINTTNEKKQYGFSSGCQVGYKIEQDEEVLFDSRHYLFCTGSLTGFILAPNEQKKFTIKFDRFGSYANKSLKKIEPGEYVLTAFLLDEQSPEISWEFKVVNP